MKFLLGIVFASVAFAQQTYNPPVRNLSGTTAPASGDCNAAAEVGAYYIQTGDTDTVPTEVYLCAQTATSYAWQPVSHYAQDAAPATCNVGSLWFDTNATAGSNLFGCTAADTWTLLGGGGGGSGDAAAAVTTTCSGVSATFTATSNTMNKFQCTLVATNVTSSTLASLTTGQGFSITVTQPAGGGITFAAPTGITGWGGIGTAANEECTQFFVADSATTAHQSSPMSCTGGSPSVVIPGSTSGEMTLVAPATGGGTITGFAGTGTMFGSAATNTGTGRQDFSGAASTATLKVGTSAPGTCTVGDVFFDSDATAGSNVLGCTATNTWTAQGGGGSSLTAPGTYAGRPACSTTVFPYATTDWILTYWCDGASAYKAYFNGMAVTPPGSLASFTSVTTACTPTLLNDGVVLTVPVGTSTLCGIYLTSFTPDTDSTVEFGFNMAVADNNVNSSYCGFGLYRDADNYVFDWMSWSGGAVAFNFTKRVAAADTSLKSGPYNHFTGARYRLRWTAATTIIPEVSIDKGNNWTPVNNTSYNYSELGGSPTPAWFCGSYNASGVLYHFVATP